MCLRSACHTCGQTLALAEEVRGQHCLHRRHHSCADCPCSTLVAPSECCMICFEGQGRWFCRGCIESWLVCRSLPGLPAAAQPSVVGIPARGLLLGRVRAEQTVRGIAGERTFVSLSTTQRLLFSI